LDEGPSHSLLYRIKAIFRPDQAQAAHKFEEDIQELLDEGAERGLITSHEGEMIQSIVEFKEIVVREIMIPRTEAVAVAQAATLSEVIEVALNHGHSRLPVFQDNIDHVVGILHVKDLLRHWGAPPEQPLPPEIIRSPYYVPLAKKVVDLLAEFRTKRTHMAIVLDEYGGTAGLVTLEDIIEEIVGEIQDEYDQEEAKIVRVGPDTILVDARLHLEDLAEYLNIELPTGNYDSVGGFITDLTGELPQEKDQIEFQGLRFTIREADERKISRVEITRSGPTNTSEDKES